MKYLLISIAMISYGCSKKDVCVRCEKGAEVIVVCDGDVSVAVYQLNAQGYYCVKE